MHQTCIKYVQYTVPNAFLHVLLLVLLTRSREKVFVGWTMAHYTHAGRFVRFVALTNSEISDLHMLRVVKGLGGWGIWLRGKKLLKVELQF